MLSYSVQAEDWEERSSSPSPAPTFSWACRKVDTGRPETRQSDMFNCLVAGTDCSQSDLRTVFGRV